VPEGRGLVARSRMRASTRRRTSRGSAASPRAAAGVVSRRYVRPRAAVRRSTASSPTASGHPAYHEAEASQSRARGVVAWHDRQRAIGKAKYARNVTLPPSTSHCYTVREMMVRRAKKAKKKSKAKKKGGGAALVYSARTSASIGEAFEDRLLAAEGRRALAAPERTPYEHVRRTLGLDE
jgi:hypothetical protein